MTTDKELMQQALDLLDDINQCSLPPTGIPLPAEIDHVMEALRARLAQPEQKHSEQWWRHEVSNAYANGYEKGRASVKQPEPEPVAHSVVAGALFDFMGWLTSRKERIVLSSADNASPAVEVIAEFAKRRGLSLNNANVQDWHTAPPQREWQTLTENEIKHLWYEACQTNLELTSQLIVHLARNIEAKLKEKNA